MGLPTSSLIMIFKETQSSLSVKNIERKEKISIAIRRNDSFLAKLFDSLTPRIMLLSSFFEQEALGNVVVA